MSRLCSVRLLVARTNSANLRQFHHVGRLSVEGTYPISVEPPNDNDCIRAANNGDPAGFHGLYQRYRKWVLNLAYRFTGNHDDALDVLQETFAYLLGKFPGFKLSSRMTTFLYPVVKHLSLSLRQRDGKFVHDEQAWRDIPSPPPPSSTEQTKAELAQVLGALAQDQREVLLMRFVDGMSLAEIAQALKISLGTVKSRLHRALHAVRDNPAARRYFLD